jgi:chromate transport protein ChrA
VSAYLVQKASEFASIGFLEKIFELLGMALALVVVQVVPDIGRSSFESRDELGHWLLVAVHVRLTKLVSRGEVVASRL